MQRIGSRSINSSIKETIYMDELFEYEIHSVSGSKYIKVKQLTDRLLVAETKKPLKRTSKALWVLSANLPLIIMTNATDPHKAQDYYYDMMKVVYEVGGAK